MERTIKVTGKGKLLVKPDQIHLFMNLHDTKRTYEEILEQSSKQAEQLKECFVNLGFGQKDLKTTFFRVDAKYENYKHDGAWKQRMIGYEFRQELKLEFDLDNELLGKVLYALAHCSVSPVFRIDYTVKDIEAVKNELLAKAIQDSKTKAEVLTMAAGVILGEIQKIDYSWDEMEVRCSPAAGMLAAKGSVTLMEGAEESYDMNIEPDDIDVADTVTVIWEIK